MDILKIKNEDGSWTTIPAIQGPKGDKGEPGTSADVPVATTEITGKVKPDGTTITITEDGTISSAGGGVGKPGEAENSEIFNDYINNKAIGKFSHIEGEGYQKEYKAVVISNVNVETQTYEISTDINKEVFPHIMEFYQEGALKHSFITKSYDHFEGFKVTSYSDISTLTAGTYDIKLISGLAIGDVSHVEGGKNIANARQAHVEGWKTMVTGYIDGAGKKIGDGVAGHAEGVETRVVGRAGHAEGRLTKAIGPHSHAEGKGTIAKGESSHAEGIETEALGKWCHAEGRYTIAKGESSHAEGHGSCSEGIANHTEGIATVAKGYVNHAEGKGTIAIGDVAHVQGQYNIPDTDNGLIDGVPLNRYLDIVGNGDWSEDDSARSNAYTLDWSGNGWYQGDVKIGGTDADDPTAISIKDLAARVAALEAIPNGNEVKY